MTNYNDGKWHGWNGGDCPVHPESVVDYVWFDEGDENELCGTTKGRMASDAVAWRQVVKFRVTKEHKEPREFWVDPERCIAVTSYHHGFIHVREVTE